MPAVSNWSVQESHATLHIGRLGLQLDITRPSLGCRASYLPQELEFSECMHAIRFHDRVSQGDEVVADHYVRGDDLIVTYVQTPPHTIRPQIYWRALKEEPVGVEIILSVQTSLLSSRPDAEIRSKIPKCKSFVLSDNQFTVVEQSGTHRSCVLLHRPNNADFSYAEMIHPTDFEQLHVDVERDAIHSKFQLFSESLEKGVIRRGRLRGILLPRTDDQAIAKAAFHRFQESESPLTT